MQKCLHVLKAGRSTLKQPSLLTHSCRWRVVCALRCGDKHKSAPFEAEIEEVLRQFDDSESAPENQNDEVSLRPLSEDALAAEADNVLEESVAPAILRPGKPRQAASSRRRQGKKVDRMEKAAARELSQKLLKRLGKEQKSKSCRSKKSKAKGCPTSNASGSLEQIMACLHADPSSARVAGHRLHKHCILVSALRIEEAECSSCGQVEANSSCEVAQVSCKNASRKGPVLTRVPHLRVGKEVHVCLPKNWRAERLWSA